MDSATSVSRLIAVDRSADSTIRDQIVDGVIAAIRGGVLSPGRRLPSSRRLADQLGVARSTIVSCYLQLEGEGWLDPAPGSGTFVAERSVQLLQSSPASAAVAPPAEPACRFDLRCGRLDPTLLDSRAWRAAWRDNFAVDWMPPPAGEPELLEQLARHLASVRGLPTPVDQLVVCSGIAEGLLLLGLGLGWAGRTVLVEDPCYNRVRRVLTRLGACVVPVDASDPARFVRTIERSTAQPVAIYLTPNHQFPLGHRLDTESRARLLRWSRANACLVIEDDYNSEHRYGARTPDSLSYTDPAADVVYLGSFSKWLDPGLRLGFMQFPPSIASAVHEARIDLGPTTARAIQLVTARLLRSGELGRHSARTRRVYSDRRNAMIGSLSRLPAVREVCGASAGQHVVAMLSRGVDSAEVVRQARARGLALHDVDFFRAAPRPDRPGLVLSFALLTPTDIRHAVAELASLPALRSARP